jgi:serine/threonine protein kinase
MRDASVKSTGPINLPPEVAAKYEVTSTLGRGGMGVVLAARHRITKQNVAIKLLLTDKLENQTAILRFKQEAEAASKLSHPNVIQVYDFGVDDGVEYLVMEHVSGRSLAEEIAEGKLTVHRFLNLFTQVCAGLSHAHRNGVVHRDLKPSNILISVRDGETDIAKIADFGIAKLTSDGSTQQLTQTGEICGSPLYMSPEQCMGQTADIRSDIFSLGCVMYEAITGEVPHAGSNTLATIHKRANEEARSFTECGITFPARLEQVVLRCLEKNPDVRYQSADDLLKALQSDAPEPAYRTAQKPFKVKRSVRIGLAIAGVLAFVAYSLTGSVPRQIAGAHPQLIPAIKEREMAATLLNQHKPEEARKHLEIALIALKNAPRDEAFNVEKAAFLQEFERLLFEQGSPGKQSPARKSKQNKQMARTRGDEPAPTEDFGGSAQGEDEPSDKKQVVRGRPMLQGATRQPGSVPMPEEDALNNFAPQSVAPGSASTEAAPTTLEDVLKVLQ